MERFAKAVAAGLILAQLGVGLAGLELYPFSRFAMFSALRTRVPYRVNKNDVVGIDRDGHAHVDVLPNGWQRVLWTGMRKHPGGRKAMLESLAHLVKDPELTRLEVRTYQLEFRRGDLVHPVKRNERVVASLAL